MNAKSDAPEDCRREETRLGTVNIVLIWQRLAVARNVCRHFNPKVIGLPYRLFL
jgi:hypothetical protein